MMRCSFAFFLSILLVQGSLAWGQAVPKAVFIIVDGIPADVVEQVATPFLDEIAQVGGYTRAYVGGGKDTYSETPTVSAVGYNSLLTGTWAHKHNVWDNDIADPNYHYWSVFRFLEEQHPEKKTAVFSTWLDNRTKLIGEGLPETGRIQLDYHFDGFELDTVQFPHDEARQFIYHIDEHVTEEAARYIRANGPDLSWVYLEYTDDIGHKFGDSPQMEEAVQIADQQVGRIWQAVQQRQQHHQEDWLVIITTDHGRDAATGKHHGGQSDRERTIWITTNAQNLNAYFREHQPGIVDIMPTLARHLKIAIPRAQAMELDGVALTGPVSLINPAVQPQGDRVHVTWKALADEGQVKLWGSNTQRFGKQGVPDDYTLLGEVPLQQEHVAVDAQKILAGFYKIVLEGPHNTVNHWVVPPKTGTE